MTTPIEEPKQWENKPVPRKSVPVDDDFEESVEPAFAKNGFRLEFRI